MRASGSDDTIRLIPPKTFSLEQALEHINDDELVEVTPKNIRMRKRFLIVLSVVVSVPVTKHNNTKIKIFLKKKDFENLCRSRQLAYLTTRTFGGVKMDLKCCT